MTIKDAVIPFIFESLPVRGALVQLDVTWQRMQEGHQYDGPVAEILGHSAAATTLIAQSLKFDGSVTLQLSSDGPISMLVMQCTDKLDLRGMAIYQRVTGDVPFAEMVGGARCAVTVDAGAMERPYQGIVEISPESLAASLGNYFARSVQVPSHLKLETGTTYCGGILLQQMPGEKPVSTDDWRRIGYLIETLRTEELADGATPDLLRKLFAEDDVRVFGARSVRFNCRCSQEKVEEVLRFLGEAETRQALKEKGQVDVTCEYCGRVRTFDAVDVSRVFAGQVLAGTESIH